MDKFRQNENSLDPVVVLFERLYFAANEDVRMVHLEQFLQSGDPMRAWVLRVLVEGLAKISISKTRMEALLLQRVQQWEWDISKAFMGDWVDCLARLWPGEKGSDGGVLDWNEVEQCLKLGNQELIEQRFVSLLDKLGESQRWLLLHLFLRKTQWGLSRQGVFRCLSKFAKLGTEGEGYWYFLKDHPDALEQLLNGELDTNDIPKGCWFSAMESIEVLSIEAVRRLNPNDYTQFNCPDGVWVQWVVTSVEKAIYDAEGNRLDGGFNDILHSHSEAVRWVGVISDKDETPGTPFVEKRLAAVKRGISFKDTVRHPVTFHLIESSGDGMFDFPEACVCPQRIAIESWDSVEVSDETLLVRDAVSDGTGPKWIRIKPEEKTLHAVLLYAMRGPRSRNFLDLTVGIKNGSGNWIPLMKVPMSDVGILDVDRLNEWMKAHVDFKKGPITEFEKTMVVEIAFAGVKPAPRRKCGLELEHVTLRRIVWEKRAEEVERLEAFVNHCEEA